MSIIEKAVERLERRSERPPALDLEAVNAADDDLESPGPEALPPAERGPGSLELATLPEPAAAVAAPAATAEHASAPAIVAVPAAAAQPGAASLAVVAEAATSPASAAPRAGAEPAAADSSPAAPAGEADDPVVGDLSGIEIDDGPGIAPADGAAGGEAPPPRTSKTIALDFPRLRGLGIITPDSTESPIAEEHRRIKRPLLMNASLDGNHRIPRGNMILVTSSIPGEGKTFTSINMAISTAMEHDRTVLLVDTDVYKADVSKILGLGDQEGLSEYLMNPGRDLSEFLVKTDMPKLTVLPSGMRHANVTELFASESMRRLVEELSTRYQDRIVIFDSPPLLATSGAGVLASLVGQVVMVVESVRTSRSAIREALHMLDAIDYVGVVINKSRERRRGGYSSYRKSDYYSYGYGQRA